MPNLAIVTGASRGIGHSVASGLAAQGWNLHLVSAHHSRLESAAQSIRNDFPAIEVTTSAIDFSDLDALRTGRNTFPSHWDLLINNAGVKVVEGAGPTSQGHEWHLGINQLAPFALTLELLPSANYGARVTTVSSIVARLSAPTNLFDRDQTVSGHYATSKLMNLAFAYELNQRLRSSTDLKLRSMSSNAAHPGFTRASKYGKRFVRPAEYLFAQNVRFGAAPILHAATTPVKSDEPFSYFGPRRIELWGEPSPAKVPSRVLDEQVRLKIWRYCEELAGVESDFLG